MNSYKKSIPTQEAPLKILYEITEKRDAHTKYFATENHGGIAAVYPEAVHYQEDGVWKEIDNALEEDSSGGAGFCNRAGALKVKFSRHGNSEKLVTVRKGNRKLSWAFLPALEKGEVKTTFSLFASDSEKDLEAQKAFPDMLGVREQNRRKMQVRHTGSGGCYEDILPGVDLCYFLRGGLLKEEILLKNREAAAEPLAFVFHHEKLHAALEKDGSVRFTLTGQEEIFFSLPAPCMYDTAGSYSGDVRYVLETEGEKSILRIVADKIWLTDPERAYPVVIDPNTETSKNSKDIQDTFVREKQPDSSVVSTYGSFCVGNTSGEGRCRAFLKFNSLPSIPGGSVIYDARIYVWQYKYSSYGGNSFYVTAHKVNGNWSSGSTTWNNQPVYDPIVQDYAKIEEVRNGDTVAITPRSFNLTKLVRDWYNTGVNNGIMLKMKNETERSAGTFVTSDYPAGNAYGITSEQYPSGIFYYRDASGLEDYYSYHTHSAGRAGSGAVNDFNGNLVFTHMDAATQGNRFPVQLNHVYNLNLENQWCRAGYGWRLSAHQELRETGLADFPYVYTDEDGTRHYFYKDKEDADKLKDEDGLGLVIKTESSGSAEEYRTMETKEKMQLIFGQDGYLRKEKDPNGNTVVYTYTRDQFGPYLTKITDASGASITLEYEATKLVRILDDAGRVTSFQYDPWNNLIRAVYPDGKATVFSFDNHELTGVKAPDGYEIRYGYVEDFRVKRISRITEKSGDSKGQELKISYRNGTTTVFEECGLDGELGNPEDNRIYTYQFDHYGRPVCISDQDGRAENYDYFKTGEKNNKLRKAGTTQKTICNYMRNTRFEHQLAHWTRYSAEPSQVQVCEDTGYIGTCSVKVQRPSGEEGASGVSQVIPLNPGTYTVSAYIRTKDAGDKGNAHLAVLGIKKDGSTENLAFSPGIKGTTDLQIDQGFVRESATFTTDSNHTAVQVIGALFDTSGTAWFTCFQLEEGDTANKFNLLENGSFVWAGAEERLPAAFEGHETGSSDGRMNGISRFGSHALHICGEIGKRKGYSQTINIRAGENMVFSVSGWGKADAVPEKEFGLTAGFAYEDGTFRFEDIPFNQNITDWQFVHKTISPNDNLAQTNKMVTCMTLYAFYGENQNDAYFDGLQVTCEDAQSYVYDDSGNLVSAVSAAEKTGFSYDKEHALSHITDITGTSFSYGYDSKKNLSVADNSEGIRYCFRHNAHGNPVEAAVQGGSHMGAVTPGRTYAVRERVSGKYLTAREKGTVSGTLCELREYDGSAAQKWKVLDAGEGCFQFIPQHAEDLSLDVVGGADKDGAGVQIYTTNHTDAQKFKVTLMEDGSCQITAKCTKGRRGLTNAPGGTGNGTEVTIWGTDDSYDRQRWYLEPADSAVTGDSPEAGIIYKIRVCHSNQYLTVPEGNSKAGAGIVQEYQKGGRNQQFLLEDAGDGYYFLRSMEARDLVLVQTGTYAGYPALTLQISDPADDGQKFRFTGMGRGYGIQCKADQKYADVYCSEYTPGTRVILTGGLGETNSNKLFLLEPCSLRIESFMEYTEDGRNIRRITDSRGAVTENSYDSQNRLLTSVTDAKGHRIRYTYDPATDRLTEAAADVGGQEVKNTYAYDAGERLSAIGHNGFCYTYEYDGFGNQTAVRAGETLLESCTYYPHNGPLKTITYGNGDTLENSYDKDYRITEQKWNGKICYKNTYDSDGNLVRHEDLENGSREEYQYDLIGRLVRRRTSEGQSLAVSYDGKNRVKSLYQKTEGSSSGSTATKTEYIYGEAEKLQSPGLIYGLKVDGSERLSYTYDVLARRNAKTLHFDNGRTYQTTYEFVPGKEAGTTTALVESITNGSRKLSYTYDVFGNIETIAEDDTVKVTYHYDELSQLIREDNVWEDRTVCYSYDAGGNMTARKVYAYTSPENRPDTVESQKLYTYGNAGWRDQLTVYDGQHIVYDGLGNPTDYLGMEMTWQHGRELKQVKKDGHTIQYTYDSEGIRTSKTVDGATTRYDRNGSSITAMRTNADHIQFIYDENGNLFSMKLNGASYYYLHNAQNDVVGLVDSSGSQVVSYRYDSWGCQTSMTDTSGSQAGSKNPFRYRGYYLDDETGLYYVSSRYYDPCISRWINADEQVSGDSILGTNLFAYCNNNPASMLDRDGREAVTIVEILAFLLICCAAASYLSGTVVQSPINIVPQIQVDSVRESEPDISWSKTTAKAVQNKVKASLAIRDITKKYRSKKETHHIVARKAKPAKYGRRILEKVGIKIESSDNKVELKTQVHRRLHSHLYYGWVNKVVISAYRKGETYSERQGYVKTALGMLKRTLEFMEKFL